jgi:hypothetical protein
MLTPTGQQIRYYLRRVYQAAFDAHSVDKRRELVNDAYNSGKFFYVPDVVLAYKDATFQFLVKPEKPGRPFIDVC